MSSGLLSRFSNYIGFRSSSSKQSHQQQQQKEAASVSKVTGGKKKAKIGGTSRGDSNGNDEGDDGGEGEEEDSDESDDDADDDDDWTFLEGEVAARGGRGPGDPEVTSVVLAREARPVDADAEGGEDILVPVNDYSEESVLESDEGDDDGMDSKKEEEEEKEDATAGNWEDMYNESVLVPEDQHGDRMKKAEEDAINNRLVCQ